MNREIRIHGCPVATWITFRQLTGVDFVRLEYCTDTDNHMRPLGGGPPTGVIHFGL